MSSNRQAREEEHLSFMMGALVMARRHLGQTSPNPSVGAVITLPTGRGDKIIARAVTGLGGTPHAEPQAIEQALAATGGTPLDEATLYVTLEPCNHHGRTPPCTEAIIKAGIKTVVIAGDDHDERVKGGGIERLREAGIKVITGICTREANRLNIGHNLARTKARPAILIKTAVSKDGLILPAELSSGESSKQITQPRWVTGPLARARGHLLRAEADAILIGNGTARLDNPSLTCRLNGMSERSPQPIILDTKLTLPENLKLFDRNAQNKTLVACADTMSESEQATYLKERQVELLPIKTEPNGRLSLNALMKAIATKGYNRLMVEGGPALEGALINAGLVDQVNIFIGTQAAGKDGIPPFAGNSLDWAIKTAGLNLDFSQTLGGDRMFQYTSCSNIKAMD